jgi:hypothetical protein
MMMITVHDRNEMDEADCKLEVDEEETEEGYHQNESIQTRQSYSFYFVLVITSPFIRLAMS